MKNIDTLVDDIYGLLDGSALLSSVERFQDDIGKMLVKRFGHHKRDGKPTLRMSNIGRPDRQLWYEMNGYQAEKIDGKTTFKFLYGDILETLVLFLAEASGHSVERLQEEIEIDGIKGHIDAVIDGTLIDVKSCSPFSFKKFKENRLAEDDPFGYIPQLTGYSTALKLPAAFLAVDKTVGNICISPLPDVKYDIYRRVEEAKKMLSGPEPERCYDPVPLNKTDQSGNLVLDIGCSYCGFKDHCWRDANYGEGLKTLVYSTGPKFFVKINKMPRLNSNKADTFPVRE